MKKKLKKEYIKTNLIGFIIAGIIVSGVAVYAAVTFPSNEVSYSNTESGLNSNNVQGAIDELYKTCTQTLGSQILENTDLQKDPYECRYFFTGANPNNYITFNGEKWRIISVECDGTIKIMRDTVLTDRVWDSSGNNNWARPSSLNTYLNGTYLTSTLNSTAQSQIIAKDWSIGAVSFDDNGLNVQINDENSKKWNGKVALITPSEYIRSNSNQSSCGTYRLNQRNYSSCKNTTWIFNNDMWWMLSSYAGDSNRVSDVSSLGYLGVNSSNTTGHAVRPSVYLSSKIKITGGDGSSSSPYQISL